MKRIITIFLIGWLICFNGFALAQDDIFAFDTRTIYDIYLRGDHETVIRDVQIVAEEERNGQVFLIVKPSGFSLTDDAGYINFDAVAAILPRNKYRVEINQKYKVYYP